MAIMECIPLFCASFEEIYRLIYLKLVLNIQKFKGPAKMFCFDKFGLEKENVGF